MENLLSDAVLGQLGVGAILAVFLFLAWRRLEGKDERIREMTDKLQDKYEANTLMTERVNNTLSDNTKTLERNNQTLEKVLDSFKTVMTDK